MKFLIPRLMVATALLCAATAYAAPPSATATSVSPVAEDDKKPEEKKPDEKKPEEKKDEKKPEEKKPDKPKPYKEVITDEAKTQHGLFDVHQVGDKYYYEIPPSALDKEMLWTTEVAKTPAGSGYGGMMANAWVIRWTRHENKVYLKLVTFDLRGDGKTAIQRAVDAANFERIIQAFDVEAEGKDKAPVIEVTKMLTSDIPEFTAKLQLGAGGIDSARSYIDSIKDLPINIEARSVLTFNAKAIGEYTPPSITALIHYSMVLLPEKPMQGRYFDSRVGYFTESFDDYASDDNGVKHREYIARYRLEKKDPSASVSEPVNPIVYYVSREVPEKWRPYIKQGIEDWREAFEQAGFKNAIIAKDAPTPEEDPNWDPEDARFSVIRWAANPIENAMGPHVHDPRSGEILSAHVIVWHDILKLIENWYFVQCGPLDLHARHLPLPEPLIGECLRYVVAHEVGHTLGLRHNHKASSSFTVAQLRDKAFTEKNGDEASIMDYGRFNYVAQPNDGARLIPKIGPYDRFAIEWGYKPIPNALTPDKEKPELDRIAARQVKDPTLRFGGEDQPSMSDPTVQTEDLGSDPIEATTYGLKNLTRLSPMLLPAATKYGEDYDHLDEIYATFIGQRLQELLHVMKLVGGVTETRYHAGHGGETFVPVAKDRQAKAVQFLLANAFHTPKWVTPQEVLRRIEPYGVTDQVVSGQRYLLSSLLGDSRVRRLYDVEALTPKDAYTVDQLVADIQHGIWEELSDAHPVVDPYRRDLQRYYVQLLKGRIQGDGSSLTEIRPIALDAMNRLEGSIDMAITKTQDPDTLLHLKSCKREIARTLRPNAPEGSGPSATMTDAIAPSYLKPSPNF